MDDSGGSQSVKRTLSEIVSVSPGTFPEIDVQNNLVPFGRFREMCGKNVDSFFERDGFFGDIVPP